MPKGSRDPQSTDGNNVSKVTGQSHTAPVSPPSILCVISSQCYEDHNNNKKTFLNNVFIGSVSNPSGRLRGVSVHLGQPSDR